MSLATFLQSVGLSKNEQRVYEALLALGDAEASRVAARSGLKRSTAFHILEELVKKGLASVYLEKNIKRFVAENPKGIKGMLEGRLAAFDKYFPELEKLFNVAGASAKVRFFDGPEGAKAILEETLESSEKIIYSIGSVEKGKEALGSSIRYAARRAAKKIFSKNLRLKGERFKPGYLENQRAELREVRFFPEGARIPVMLHIWDAKIAFIASKDEGFGLIIESKGIAEAMKSLFSMLWEMSERTIR